MLTGVHRYSKVLLRQAFHLRTVLYVITPPRSYFEHRAEILMVTHEIGLYLILTRVSAEGLWRIVSEDFPCLNFLSLGIFPADCLYLMLFKPLSLFFRITVWAHKSIEGFQHIAKFYNYNRHVYSYRRHSPGLIKPAQSCDVTSLI